MNTCEDLGKYLLISQLLPMCHKNQDTFLSSLNNKVQLIAFLADLLLLNQHVTKISEGDAVTLIVSTALSFANNSQSVMFEAEGTDIFIMLIHHWKTDMGDMNLYKEGKRTQNKVAWL